MDRREELLKRKMGQGPVFRGNAATEFGLEMEPHAVALYERLTDSKVAPTGLHMHPNLRWGASPDGLVRTEGGEAGLLEVKCFFRCRGTGVVPQITDPNPNPKPSPSPNPNPNPNPILPLSLTPNTRCRRSPSARLASTTRSKASSRSLGMSGVT